MLTQSIIIFLLVILLICIDYNDTKINTLFSDIFDGKIDGIEEDTESISPIKEKYTNLSPHITGQARPYQPGINFGKTKGFGNFGIVAGPVGGVNPLCNQVTLKYDCSPYPYDVSSGDNKMNVCSVYKETTPEMTSARTVGRPRQCRNTYAQ